MALPIDHSVPDTAPEAATDVFGAAGAICGGSGRVSNAIACVSTPATAEGLIPAGLQANREAGPPWETSLVAPRAIRGAVESPGVTNHP